MSGTARRPIVVANWKMHSTPGKAGTLATETLDAIAATGVEAVEVVLCPPAIALSNVHQAIGARAGLGAQNMHWLDQGAYTGEISPSMVAELCRYVIVGHSERRQHFGETDDRVRQKVGAALKHGITPIICVGESLEQRNAGQTADWVALQVRAALHGHDTTKLPRVVIAYEPIWAIGTGAAANGADANEVASGIRAVLRSVGGVDVATAVRVQYGGSVTAANAAEFLTQPEIDGALVGGASLKPAEFAGIVAAAARRN